MHSKRGQKCFSVYISTHYFLDVDVELPPPEQSNRTEPKFENELQKWQYNLFRVKKLIQDKKRREEKTELWNKKMEEFETAFITKLKQNASPLLEDDKNNNGFVAQLEKTKRRSRFPPPEKYTKKGFECFRAFFCVMNAQLLEITGEPHQLEKN